ncbi:PD-(D/E)XK nuclease family protein [Tunturiibacter lichenicola]|uniref:PD-(D/E)XK nuclease family protein n=1 Tax=Tunturiibacter lichenicola TaxID=2051959 RepID=UPI003D9B5D47
MDGRELLPGEIVAALERGAIVVTGNQRAARTLRRGFDRRNRTLGFKTWQPPMIMAWDAWMTALWHELVMDGHATQMLLNRTQEHALWRTVLEADEELASLRTVDSLATVASEAWRLICNYDGRQRLRGAIGNSDTRSFQRWARMFERRCQVEGFITQAQLEDTLHDAIRNKLIALPPSGVILVGFDGMTPAQRKLVEVLRSASVEVEELQLSVDVARHNLVGVEDEQQEFSVAARWTRRFLEAQPDGRVALIVPGLELKRREIDRVFRDVLAPELQDIRTGSQTGPYEFSLGTPLAEIPMVAIAFDLLQWTSEPLPLERVSRLLLSRYFAMRTSERGARAEFDAFGLRKARTLRPEISLDELIALAERSKWKGRLPLLISTLRSIRTVVNRLRGFDARTHAEWAERMRELLNSAAWGPDSSETSFEFQVRRKWESALDELATLDFDGVNIDLDHALAELIAIARNTMFAPESRDAPVQIMDPLEAAGGIFDAVWFLHAGELNWPIVAMSNSLLPWHLQRELGMPGTDVARDDAFARRMTERIAGSAQTVVFSYAKMASEGSQRPSATLAELRLAEIEPADILEPEATPTLTAIEEIEDTAPIHALPDRVIRGGARILELQAACGFRAFAEQRLWATDLESIEPGMDARESGTVVHKVLEIFWDEVKTQDALRAMTTQQRSDVLKRCIAQGLNKTLEASTTTWDDAYLDVQQARLLTLLSGWLHLELERKLPFEVQLSEKEFKDVRVGPLRLNVRMDRVDKVEGGEVLIDYKTGTASPNDWLTARPDAPQLPLYAILSQPDQLQAVAFGIVRVGVDREMKGYAVNDDILPGKSTKFKEAPTLAAQVEQWRIVLEGLAEEFHSGDARVRPKMYPKTCQHCGQRLLCRLDTSLFEDVDEGDESSEAEVILG